MSPRNKLEELKGDSKEEELVDYVAKHHERVLNLFTKLLPEEYQDRFDDLDSDDLRMDPEEYMDRVSYIERAKETLEDFEERILYIVGTEVMSSKEVLAGDGESMKIMGRERFRKEKEKEDYLG